MRIDELNDEYKVLKAKLNIKNDMVKTTEENVAKYAKELEGFKADLEKAKEENNLDDKKEALLKIYDVKEKINQATLELIKARDEVKGLNEQVNEKVSVLEQNPEVKQVINEALGKKYERKVESLKKEKEEVKNKKERMNVLKETFAKHPTLNNNLKGLLSANEEIAKYNEELKSLTQDDGKGNVTFTDPDRASEIKNKLLPFANKKMETNKTKLFDYANANKIDITMDDIKELADSGIVRDRDGQVVTEKMFNAVDHKYNRQIKGLDKNIKNHEKAFENIGKTEKSSNKEENSKEEDEKSENKPVWGKVKSAVTRVVRSNPEEKEEKKEEKSLAKPSRWQEIKGKMKDFFNGVKNRFLPNLKNDKSELNTETKTEPKEELATGKNKRGKDEKGFKNSLRYDVVHDMYEKADKDVLKQAKQQNKQQSKDDQER